MDQQNDRQIEGQINRSVSYVNLYEFMVCILIEFGGLSGGIEMATKKFISILMSATTCISTNLLLTASKV